MPPVRENNIPYPKQPKRAELSDAFCELVLLDDAIAFSDPIHPSDLSELHSLRKEFHDGNELELAGYIDEWLRIISQEGSQTNARRKNTTIVGRIKHFTSMLWRGLNR